MRNRQAVSFSSIPSVHTDSSNAVGTTSGMHASTSWRSGSPSSPTTDGSNRIQRERRTPKELWRDAIQKVKLHMAHMGRSPMVPVSRIEELKSYFTDAKTGKLIELDQDAFCDAMTTALKGRDYSFDELSKWFADMDVDLSNSVSWEEFTSFMISAATSYGEDNIRAKEFLPDNTVTPMTALLHKDSIKRLVTNRSCPYLVSGGFDGFVKLWSPTNGQHVYAINNNLYSAAHEAVPAGSAVPLSPIVDIAFNVRGSHCFVAAADKSVNIYDAKTFALSRKFVGTSGASLEASYWKPNNLGCNGVPDVHSRRYHHANNGASSFRTLESVDASVLLNMTESPSSLDIATPHDNEVLFFATHEGSIMAYPSLRSSVLPDIPQLAYYPNVHAQPIAKMRYVAPLRALVAASWDTSISLTNPDTGQCIHRLLGHDQQTIDLSTDVLATVDIGHRKSALDFAFSDAHHVLATVGADRAIMIWNPMFSMPVASLRGHTAPLNSVAFDEIDNLLVSMDCSGVVKTWDLRMHRCLQTFGGSGSKSEVGGGGGGGSSNGGGGGGPSDNKLDTPTAMIFSPEHHRIFSGGRSISSWTVRRAQTHFHPTHIGHCEGIISYAAFPATSSVVTGDANVLMRWCVKNGRRQSLWDINPPSVDGGDMLKQASGGGGGGGGDAGGGSLQQVSALACFDRDAAQRRILAVTVDGVLIAYNPTNGQQLRRMDISAYLSDEPFRVVHLCNAHNSSKVIAVLSGREVVLISEDADEVTGLLPFAPFGSIPAPPSTTAGASQHRCPPGGGGGAAASTELLLPLATFSAVAVYPAVGASTLPSLVVGTTEGHLQVFTPLQQELTASVMHPRRARTARHSSHRTVRRPSDASRLHTPQGGSGSFAPNNNSASSLSNPMLTAASSAGGASPVEDIVYLRSLDLFATCVGDNSLFFWDLRNGLLKFQFTTMLQPQECILSIASGEDTMPFVSYDTVLTKRGGSTVSLKSALLMQQQQQQQEQLQRSGGGRVGGGTDKRKQNPPIRSFADLISEALTVRNGALALAGDMDAVEVAAAKEDGPVPGNTTHRGDNGSSLRNQPPSASDPEVGVPQPVHPRQQQHEPRHQPQHRVLISGCDWGYVYVWDISALPASTAPTATFVRCTIPLLSVFRAHNAPITRLSFFEAERLICTMSTVDCYVKTFLMRGSMVGHMGQRIPFWYRDAKTYAADPCSVPVEDEHIAPAQQQQSPSPISGLPPLSNSSIASGGGGGGLPPRNPCPALGSGGVSPIITAASRPATRQLDSPASSTLFTSSFFATAVAGRHATARHAVESPRDIDTACFALVPEVADATTASANYEFSPHAMHSGGSDGVGHDVATIGAGGGGGGGRLWVSPFANHHHPPLPAHSAVQHRHAIPIGLRCTNGRDDAPPNLRPVLFAKKRLSIRATETEGIEAVRQRRPRHMASVVQHHHHHHHHHHGIVTPQRSSDPPTPLSPATRSRCNSSDATVFSPSPTNALAVPCPGRTPPKTHEAAAVVALQRSAQHYVLSPPALQLRGVAAEHEANAPPLLEATPRAVKPPRSPLPSIAMPKYRSSPHDGDGCPQGAEQEGERTGGILPSFLLTELASTSVQSSACVVKSDGDAVDLACSLARRSQSVPLLRRTKSDHPGVCQAYSEVSGDSPLHVLKRSSGRYRCMSSMSCIPVASPTNINLIGRDAFDGGGSQKHDTTAKFGIVPLQPHASSPPLNARSPSPSPHSTRLGGSPKSKALADRSVVHRGVLDLHRIGTSQKSDTESRVDRVTRLIRDRELLKYQPLLIQTSLLDENESMRREVAVIPSAWTSRASSLLKTHEFALEDIKKYWSPKKKEINKAKLLRWNE